MRSFDRWKELGWWSDRVTSFWITFLAYFAVLAIAFIGHTIYEMLPPLDWDKILTIVAGVFFFCINWYLVDDTLWG